MEPYLQPISAEGMPVAAMAQGETYYGGLFTTISAGTRDAVYMGMDEVQTFMQGLTEGADAVTVLNHGLIAEKDTDAFNRGGGFASGRAKNLSTPF